MPVTGKGYDVARPRRRPSASRPTTGRQPPHARHWPGQPRMSYVPAAASVDPVPPDDMSSPKSPLETGQRWRPGGFWIFLGGVRRVADVTQEAPGNRRGPPTYGCGLASKRSRRRVLHQRSHLGTNACGRMQLDRCCLVIRMQKMKPLAPNFNCYVERVDCPAAPQHPHRGRDCRCASVAKVVIGERKNNGSELDGPGLLRRWEGYHSTQSPRRPATGLLVDEDGIRT